MQAHKTPLPGEKSVAIVGAGPGGLTLARLLQMRDVSVKVYERDASRTARVQGATLNINAGEGLLAIEKAGLLDAFRRAYRPGAGAMKFFDPQGNVLIDDFGHGEDSHGDELTGPNARPEIDRGPLRDLLLDSLRDGTVEWNKQFVSLSRERTGVRLAFRDGTTATADLIVGCDGGSSKVRSWVTSAALCYSGVTIVEGAVHQASVNIPAVAAQVGVGKLCVLGDSKSFFIVMKGDDTAAFYFGIEKTQTWARESGLDFNDAGSVAAWFAEEFRTWNPMWLDVIARSSNFVVRPQFFCPLDQHWEANPDLTLLGDAAHVMPPYAGAGVNNAMLDALDLSEALLGGAHDDLRSAIGAYEDVMLRRAAEVGQQTKEFTRIFHSPDPLPQFQRFFADLGTAASEVAPGANAVTPVE